MNTKRQLDTTFSWRCTVRGGDSNLRRSYVYTLMLLVCLAGLVQTVSGEQFGSLRLCPPGQRSFNLAWNLACEMKRKKRSTLESTVFNTAKRSSSNTGSYRPATLTEIMNICCDVGCEIRDLLAYCDPFGQWDS